VSDTTDARRRRARCWLVEPVEPGSVEDCRLAEAHAVPLDDEWKLVCRASGPQRHGQTERLMGRLDAEGQRILEAPQVDLLGQLR
jgi:hypothetical protein